MVATLILYKCILMCMQDDVEENGAMEVSDANNQPAETAIVLHEVHIFAHF